MNAHTAISTRQAEELRILELHTQRALKVLQDHVQLYRRDPNYAELVLCDALSFVVSDPDIFINLMDQCCVELGIDDEGFPLDDEGFRDCNADREWVPLEALK